MKYGQQLATEQIPVWDTSFKTLKKSIKRIESELASFGLNAEILKELLSTNNAASAAVRQETLCARPAIGNRLKSSSSNSALSIKSRSLKTGRQNKRKQSKARAEYELAGTVSNPIPRIKLVFSSASSESASSAEENLADALYARHYLPKSSLVTERNEQEQEEEERVSSEPNPSDTDHRSGSDDEMHKFQSREFPALLEKMYGHGIIPLDEVMPPGSPMKLVIDGVYKHRSNKVSSLRVNEGEDERAVLNGPDILLDNMHLNDEFGDADGESDERDETTPISDMIRKRKRRRLPRRHRQELTINLEYDGEFFTLLNQALSSLTTLLQTQKQTFLGSVQELAKSVSQTSSPARNRNDLYAWRDVFSLWVEAQIFESDSERSRGERSITECEKRLDWFADQVGRRKLAQKMKSKESKSSLERFVQLNQELLQLKRIGIANQEAARKILKKHDKRLGLSASQGFPDFVYQQQRQEQSSEANSGEDQTSLSPRSVFARKASSSEMTSLIFSGLTTLPHVLLTSFTDILLPIVPQIDDYSCLICSDIAWRPIVLDCGHRFCVRCLVKMQQRAQNACPACRAPVVMKANKNNVDKALIAYQQRWFPKEIKAKDKDAKKEIEQEVAREMQLETKCCVQ